MGAGVRPSAGRTCTRRARPPQHTRPPPRSAARVRAAPDKGAANTELCALTAKTLGVPKSTVSVIAGATQREKTLLVRSEESIQLLDAVTALLHDPGS